MKRYNLLLYALAIFSLLNCINAEYWFQFGARAGSSAYYNSGAGVSIHTVLNQQITSGSLGFWVGETLPNGAFLQIGYVVENESGQYPSFCDQSGCSGYENIKAGDAEWFYEYFPASGSSTFLGGIGPDGSAGADGTVNNYAFYSNGNTWYFLFNGKIIGSADLGASNSGQNAPVAFGEVANASNAQTHILPVIFSNLTEYKSGSFYPVPNAYSFIGYGQGSRQNLPNPYGIEELNNIVNYFEVGSGLPQPPNSHQLWSFGYSLSIVSRYGNISSISNRIPYTYANLSAPQVIYITKGTRAVFKGWVGQGSGSYSGPSNSTAILLISNTTETAQWQLQYLLNISSQYAGTAGSGWYNANSSAAYSLDSHVSYVNSTSRFNFTGWSNGNRNLNGSVAMFAPVSISATWVHQFLVNVSSQYGNVTGYGWHDIGSNVSVSVLTQLVPINQSSRIAFFSWSNGNPNATVHVIVNTPVYLRALFKTQYLVNFVAEDSYGNPLSAQSFYISNKSVGTSSFLFSGSTYNVTGVMYKNTKMNVLSQVMVSSPATIYIRVPVYNVYIKATDILGKPLNATGTITLPNRTAVPIYTGSSGEAIIADVPYGRASGTLDYIGEVLPVQTSAGNIANVVFVSSIELYTFVFIVVIAVVFYIVAARIHNKRHMIEEQIRQQKS